MPPKKAEPPTNTELLLSAIYLELPASRLAMPGEFELARNVGAVGQDIFRSLYGPAEVSAGE